MSPAPRTSWLARLFGNHRPKPVEDVPVDAEMPSPLSTRRIGDYLSRRGYHSRIDDDGDVTGTWDGNRFWFLLLGDHPEILQVRGRWSTTVPVTHPGVTTAAGELADCAAAGASWVSPATTPTATIRRAAVRDLDTTFFSSVSGTPHWRIARSLAGIPSG